MVLTSANDIDVFGRTFESMKEAFLSLQGADETMELTINQSKTKYMCTEPMGGDPYIHIASHTF